MSGGATHTDADAIHLSRTGVPTAVVSIPLRYMHSPVELVDLEDVENVIRLITAMALRLEDGHSAVRAGSGRVVRSGQRRLEHRLRHPLGHRLGREPTSSRRSAGLPWVT